MSPCDNWLSGEPPVTELMADPILHMILRRDRLRAHEVWRTLRRVQQRLDSNREHASVPVDAGTARRPLAAADARGHTGGDGDQGVKIRWSETRQTGR